MPVGLRGSALRRQADRDGVANKRLTEAELSAALDGTKLNIAIALNQSGMIDVECDSPEAEPDLQILCGGKVPLTPTWQSKHSKHRLFRRPAGLPAKAKLELDGVEFRIGNGKGSSCDPAVCTPRRAALSVAARLVRP